MKKKPTFKRGDRVSYLGLELGYLPDGTKVIWGRRKRWYATVVATSCGTNGCDNMITVRPDVTSYNPYSGRHEHLVLVKRDDVRLV